MGVRGAVIPVLTATDLMVFKRTRDRADIEALLKTRAGDADEAARWIEGFLGPEAVQLQRPAATRTEIPMTR